MRPRVSMMCFSIIFILALLTLGCGKAELTRDKAAALINSAASFNAPENKVPLSGQGFSGGQAFGYWNANGELSSKGRQFFANVSRRSSVTIVQPVIRTVIDVTGIADAVTPLAGQKGGSIKEAPFTWKYSNVAPEPKRVIAAGGTGTAIIRLFDDGWRIDSIKFQASTEPIILSPEEKTAAELELKAEMDRKKAERERWNSMVRNATTPSKEIWKSSWASGSRAYTMSVSDVGLQITVPSSPGYRMVVSYADIKSIRYEDQYFSIQWIDRKRVPPLPSNKVFNDYVYLATGIESQRFQSKTECRSVFNKIAFALHEWKTKYPELVGKGDLSQAMR